MEFEQWKAIAGASSYEVSSEGRIRSYKNNRWGRSELPKVMKATVGGNGYLHLNIYGDDKRGYPLRYVHHLVAEAFLGMKKVGMQINHIDGCKTNNAISNLEITTPASNSQHAWRIGLNEALRVAATKQMNRAKLNAEQVKQIRERLAAGENTLNLAEEFHVDRTNINLIRRRATWKDI